MGLKPVCTRLHLYLYLYLCWEISYFPTEPRFSCKYYTGRIFTCMPCLCLVNVLESEKFLEYVIMLGDGRVQLEGYADDLRREHDLSLQELTREVFA